MNKWIVVISLFFFACASNKSTTTGVAKPLFDDPVYHGAADPVVIYNDQKKLWYMLYTNRRASLPDTSGVEWVHGTKIGIASSKDGKQWQYVDTTNINYRPDKGYTFWAPDVIRYDNLYHMYLTYVPGTFSNWSHPRYIVHLTSTDLHNWTFQSKLKLAQDKVIDASVYRMPNGVWRMWYNNESDKKSIWYAESNDLFNWVDKGKALSTRGEGAKVFHWKGKYWMLVDAWKGIAIYSGATLDDWQLQPTRILEEPGKGIDDGAIGGHCDVVVNNDRAYIFYFTHPGRTPINPAARGSFDDKRSVIQLAELQYDNGIITCDRNAAVSINLNAKG